MRFAFDSNSSCIVLLSFLALAVFSTSLVVPLSSYGQHLTTQDAPVIEIPQIRWYYRWGDSPMDDQGMPLWIYEDISSPEWKPIKKGSRLLENWQGYHNLWLLIQLPEGNWKYPAILLPPVSQSFEMYQNHQLIYRFGELKMSDSNKYSVFRYHLVPLGSGEAKKGSNALFLRIYSGSRHIGMERDKIWLGSQTDLIKVAIKLDIESFILGSLFTFAGLLSAFVYFRRRKQKLYIILSFAAFAGCVGIGHLGGGAIGQLFIEATAVWYYVGTITFLLWPIFLYVFIEQILGRGYKSLIRRIWQFHIFFAVGVFLLDITNVFPMTSALPLFFSLLMADVFITIPIAAKVALKGNFEAKVLSTGMGILMLSGIHDIFAEFGVIPRWQMLFSWGVFVFILFLAYILEYRFAQAHHQLEEYSLTLEQKVSDRTQELSEKNAALEQAFQQLKEAQSQLIMQEKMASLGNLVAGVAHEMNNPIGVVLSAADIANRGIHRIKNLLQSKQDLNRSKYDEEQLQQSFKLLETNHAVITTASDQIARIVQSLRTFARLDEAPFQALDLHENIDTTLTLVYHELRDKVTIIKEYGEIPRIHGYPSELNQMFVSLLRNAAQAIEEQGTITIATHADKTQVYMKISDTGKGIPPDDLPRIFDPGFTTHSVGVHKGLGLSIVYNIVQKHHGDIKVDSGVGKGTEVTVALPILPPPSTEM